MSLPILPDARRSLTQYLAGWLLPGQEMPCDEWVEENIDLTLDTTSAADGLVNLDLTPYLREPLRCWNERGKRLKVTVMAPEQTAKTSPWVWGLMYRMERRPAPALIVWQNDDIAAEKNQEQVEPLMRGIPKLRRELDSPGSKRADRYLFSDMVVHFCGSGSPVTSHPAAIVVGDEVDFWNLPSQANNSSIKALESAKNVSNIRNLDKRTRTFAESLRWLSCSPTLPNGPINQEYARSSQGEWHVRCLGCGGLTVAHDMRPMRFEMDESGNVLELSIRWVCPSCGRKHVEGERQAMNLAGEFVHRHPERLGEHRGFQWSALASPFISWRDICEALRDGGGKGTIEGQMFLDQSIRGLPFRLRGTRGQSMEEFKRAHCRALPADDEVRYVLFGADTQDTGWYWGAVGLGEGGQTWRLGNGFAATDDDLERAYNALYAGKQCRYGIIDEGGHRTLEVDALIRRLPNCYSYKGVGRQSIPWELSRNKYRLIRANPHIFQHRLLWHMHRIADGRASFFHLPPTPDAEYLEQLLSVRPPANKPKADISEWRPADGADDHYFDVEKMIQVLLMAFHAQLSKPPPPAAPPPSTEAPRSTDLAASAATPMPRVIRRNFITGR